MLRAKYVCFKGVNEVQTSLRKRKSCLCKRTVIHAEARIQGGAGECVLSRHCVLQQGVSKKQDSRTLHGLASLLIQQIVIQVLLAVLLVVVNRLRHLPHMQHVVVGDRRKRPRVLRITSPS